MELDSKFDFEAKLSEFSEGIKELKLDDDENGFRELDKVLSEFNKGINELKLFDNDDWSEFDSLLSV